MGYGFGLRYGFENLFPAFQEGGSSNAIGLVSGDLNELMQKLIQLSGIPDRDSDFAGQFDTEFSQIDLLTGDDRRKIVDVPTLGGDDMRVVAPPDLPGGAPDIEAGDHAGPHLGEPWAEIKYTYKDRDGHNDVQVITATESEHKSNILDLALELKTSMRHNGTGHPKTKWLLSHLSGYQWAFKQAFGYWYDHRVIIN